MSGGGSALPQARTQPALHRLSGERPDPFERLADGLVFPVLCLDRPLVKAVADHLPAGIEDRFGQPGIGLDDARIEGAARGQAASLQGFEQPGHAAAQAVFSPAEIGDVRRLLVAMRRGQELARHRLVEGPMLDVDHHVDNERCAGSWRRQEGPV
jgi:hypothetical protein